MDVRLVTRLQYISIIASTRIMGNIFNSRKYVFGNLQFFFDMLFAVSIAVPTTMFIDLLKCLFRKHRLDDVIICLFSVFGDLNDPLKLLSIYWFRKTPLRLSHADSLFSVVCCIQRNDQFFYFYAAIKLCTRENVQFINRFLCR